LDFLQITVIRSIGGDETCHDREGSESVHPVGRSAPVKTFLSQRILSD